MAAVAAGCSTDHVLVDILGEHLGGAVGALQRRRGGEEEPGGRGQQADRQAVGRVSDS